MVQTPEGPLANFLLDFGPAKYQPKGILVFSAHWEGQGEQLKCYTIKFSSRGDGALSKRVVQLFQDACIPVRLTPKDEPVVKVDEVSSHPAWTTASSSPPSHVWRRFHSVPIVQASIDGSLSPEVLAWRAIWWCAERRHLDLSGGFTIHSLDDNERFLPETASSPIASSTTPWFFPSPFRSRCKETALVHLTLHESFRLAHPVKNILHPSTLLRVLVKLEGPRTIWAVRMPGGCICRMNKL
ncbi:hypothetical protein EI94DRAFT_1695734 [Lactarius quietus]|nr:hypothetical protein EI94DRAFT_1695734 [Lactarius quietus]